MWAWLNGPGKVFREPRKGSTNYLGAYDRAGRLIRENDSLQQQRKAETSQTSDGAAAEDERTAEAGGRDGLKGTQQGDKPPRQPETPPETLEDLVPFPLNKFFHSQAVLSDELKDEIYRRVTQGTTVREVSMALHVEMSRVAAVVRLKTVEQNWLRDVSPLSFPQSTPPKRPNMMRHNKNSISLEDIYMVRKTLQFSENKKNNTYSKHNSTRHQNPPLPRR